MNIFLIVGKFLNRFRRDPQNGLIEKVKQLLDFEYSHNVVCGLEEWVYDEPEEDEYEVFKVSGRETVERRKIIDELAELIKNEAKK